MTGPFYECDSCGCRLDFPEYTLHKKLKLHNSEPMENPMSVKVYCLECGTIMENSKRDKK